MTTIARITDPSGRRVELTAEHWEHILAARPFMAELQSEILSAVSAPTRMIAGLRTSEAWFYLADVGPSRWLKVVVVFEEGRGFIVTAFPRRGIP